MSLKWLCGAAMAAVLSFGSVAAQAGVLYSNADPSNASFTGLYSTFFYGAIEDNIGRSPKTVNFHTEFFAPTVAGPLKTVTIPVHTWPAARDLNMALFEVDAADKFNPGKFQLLDVASVPAPATGKNWISFDFTPGGAVTVDPARLYALRFAVDYTGGIYGYSVNYWLWNSSSTTPTGFNDTISFPANTPGVPYDQFGLVNPTSAVAAIHITDVPEPGASALLGVGGLAALRRRRPGAC